VFLVIVTAELGGSSVITAPSIRRRQSGCVGNLKSFQVETAPRPANFTFFGSRRVLRVALPDTVYLTAEGNCCWEVYRGRRFRSTVTSVSTSDGELRVSHKIRSVLQVPCYSTAGLGWLSLVAAAVMVVTAGVAAAGYRQLRRCRDTCPDTGTRAAETTGPVELGKMDVSVISEHY